MCAASVPRSSTRSATSSRCDYGDRPDWSPDATVVLVVDVVLVDVVVVFLPGLVVDVVVDDSSGIVLDVDDVLLVEDVDEVDDVGGGAVELVVASSSSFDGATKSPVSMCGA